MLQSNQFMWKKFLFTYIGKVSRSSDCVWLKEEMGMGNVLMLAEEARGEGLRECRL